MDHMIFLLIHPLMGARGCVHRVAIVNSAAMNLGVHVSPARLHFQCLWIFTWQWDWRPCKTLCKPPTPRPTSKGGEPGQRLGCTQETGSREFLTPSLAAEGCGGCPGSLPAWVLCLVASQ